MEIAFILAIIAVCVFGGAFFRSQPGWDLLALGLALFAGAFAIFIWVSDGNLFR